MRQFDITATINPKTVDDKFLIDLHQSGVTIFRINGAHIDPSDITEISKKIKKSLKNKVKIQVDLEGSKIRTKDIYEPICIKKGKLIELKQTNFNRTDFISILDKGDVILSSDGQLELTVEKITKEKVSLSSRCEGFLQNNKGVHLTSKSLAHLPVFTQKDQILIEHMKESQIDYAGISFVRSPEQVKEVLSIFHNSPVKPIIKLETKEATKNETLKQILSLYDTFSIDRGDLMSEVGIIQFPEVFNHTLEACLSYKKRIFVATQIFASMVNHNLPYISELMEFSRLYHANISGIQLSEEIAIGKYPFEILKLINEMKKSGEK
ncbi:MAG: hypothetical protein CVV30_03000 [Methanomicrobiales archaeon HGW-Methanomicrobiales-1]|jgi:pyruvate kinase|nr:MAG: hypothetical protein CVV30_03000 [Methanomicrobiales archaeon HGW-Methanomicrobiales-1]